MQEAVRDKLSHDEIMSRKQHYMDHLKWMMKQRAVLESIIQKSNHEKFLVENSDKCGDQCLYLPSSNRVSSENVSKYRYRISLQANVYAGKLFHLSILLPNLITGENFGITSFLSGLVSMIQLKEVTPSTRFFMRGVDGGSENVNHASLGMNAFLVHHHRFDVVQQHRLPPSHSHIHLTDGTFSVIEQWLTGNGFAGCKSLAELITYLRLKFAKAKNYANKKVEINILIANFAFNKWFNGHLHMNKVCSSTQNTCYLDLTCECSTQVRRIGDPLVWRHRWCPDRGEVIHQYKYALSDESTFERDEWGPWKKQFVTTNDPETGALITKEVLRSDPDGVALVKSYPSVDDFPGLEEWLDMETWKAETVFSHLQKWKFHNDEKAARASWNEMHSWHKAHQSANEDIDLGKPISLPSASFCTTPLSWVEMWRIIFQDVVQDYDESRGVHPKADGTHKQEKKQTKFLHPLSKVVDREALSKSTNEVELNRITNPNYKETEQSAAIAGDESCGAAYLDDHINQKGALFFISLKHFEGELAVGLGRRTFNDDIDNVALGRYEIEWFERKNKRAAWGKKPSFQLSVAEYRSGRKKVYNTSVESIKDFIPLVVTLTKASKGTEFPILSQHTMDALRLKVSTDKAKAKANAKVPRKPTKKKNVVQSDSSDCDVDRSQKDEESVVSSSESEDEEAEIEESESSSEIKSSNDSSSECEEYAQQYAMAKRPRK